MDPLKHTSFLERFFLGKLSALRYGRFIYQLLQHLNAKPYYLFLSVGLDFFAAAISYLRIFMLLPLVRSLILTDHEHLNKTWVIIYLRKFAPFVTQTFTPLSIALTGFLALSLLHIALTYLSGKLMDAQSRALITTLRSRIYQKILRTTREFQEKQSLSKFNTLITRNIESVASQLHALHQVISENLKLLSFGLAMLSISWRMTLITVAITMSCNFFATLLHRRLRLVADREKMNRDNLDQDLFQSVSYLPLYQSLGTEQREYFNFSHHSTQQARSAHEQKKMMLTQDAMEEIAILGSLLAMALYMIVFNPARSASEASIYLLFFFLVRNVGLGINAIDRFRNALTLSFNSFRETLPWLEDADAIVQKFLAVTSSRSIETIPPTSFHTCPNPVPFPQFPTLRFSEVFFHYSGKPPLFQNLNLEFTPSAWTVIMGPSGCGKSSLIHLFYFQPTIARGQVTIGGIPTTQIPMPELRREIAYVPHESQFFPKSIRENLCYGLPGTIDDQRLLDLCKQFELAGFLAQLPEGLDSKLGEQGTRLSAGEKQRLALVRALLRDRPIYFFDEATSALDFATEAKVLRQLQLQLTGKTVIFISHRPSALAYARDLVQFNAPGVLKKIILRDEQGLLTPEGTKLLAAHSVSAEPLAPHRTTLLKTG